MVFHPGTEAEIKKLMTKRETEIREFLAECDKMKVTNPIGWMRSRGMHLFTKLKGAFPRGIMPSDCDGEVELKGKFLRLEYKSEHAVRNGAIPTGQRIALEALVRSGYHTVIVVGENDKQEVKCAMELRPVEQDGGCIIDKHWHPKLDDAGFWDICHQWSQRVEPKID